MFGVVTWVGTEQAGTELVGDHANGATELHVVSGVGLPIPGKVQLLDADPLPYDDVDTSEDPDWDLDYDIIHLVGSTSQSFDDGTPVLLFPVRKTKTALVVLDGDTIPLECIVKRQLWDNLPNGPRADGDGEVVHLVQRGPHLVVDDVQGEPQLDLSNAYGTLTRSVTLGPGVSIKLASGSSIKAADDGDLVTGDDTGELPSAMAAVSATVLATSNAVAVLQAQYASAGRVIDGGVF